MSMREDEMQSSCWRNYRLNISLKFFQKERIKRGEDSLLPPPRLLRLVSLIDGFLKTVLMFLKNIVFSS